MKTVYSFAKHELKALKQRVPQANLTVRNFPQTADALRRKLKLRDGGNVYLFATTIAPDVHIIMECVKANFEENDRK